MRWRELGIFLRFGLDGVVSRSAFCRPGLVAAGSRIFFKSNCCRNTGKMKLVD